MNTVYEGLRSLLRAKELEIKRLEREVEALRVVLPIVAEAGEAAVEALPSPEPQRTSPEPLKAKAVTAGPDFDSVMAQVKTPQPSLVATPQGRPGPVPDIVPGKPRTSWP